jgi:hypothetical protein
MGDAASYDLYTNTMPPRKSMEFRTNLMQQVSSSNKNLNDTKYHNTIRQQYQIHEIESYFVSTANTKMLPNDPTLENVLPNIS